MKRSLALAACLGILGMSIPAAAQPSGTYRLLDAPPVLVDANGRPFATTFGPNTAFIRAPDGQLLYLQVNATGFSTSGDMVVFTTTDCRGTPYILQQAFSSFGPFTSASFVPLPGQPLGLNGDLYYPRGKGVTLTFNSTFYGGACGSFQTVSPAVPAAKIALRGFVTPLTAK